jgi:hypothetical protein
MHLAFGMCLAHRGHAKGAPSCWLRGLRVSYVSGQHAKPKAKAFGTFILLLSAILVEKVRCCFVCRMFLFDLYSRNKSHHNIGYQPLTTPSFEYITDT